MQGSQSQAAGFARDRWLRPSRLGQICARMSARKCLDRSQSNNRQMPPTRPLSCHGVSDLIQIAWTYLLESGDGTHQGWQDHRRHPLRVGAPGRDTNGDWHRNKIGAPSWRTPRSARARTADATCNKARIFFRDGSTASCTNWNINLHCGIDRDWSTVLGHLTGRGTRPANAPTAQIRR